MCTFTVLLPERFLVRISDTHQVKEHKEYRITCRNSEREKGNNRTDGQEKESDVGVGCIQPQVCCNVNNKE